MPASTPSSPTKSTSASRLDDPVHPRDSWEVAYIYAFLTKFTALRSLESITTLLLSPMVLEAALLSSSPSLATKKKAASHKKRERSDSLSSLSSSSSSLSSLSDANDQDEEEVPPEPSPLMVQILKALLAFEKDPGGKKADWYGWLVRWEAERIAENDTSLGEKRLLVGEGGESVWWGLKWQQKAHILRVVIDHQLTYCQRVRELLVEGYDGQKQRIIKRTADRNPLILEPLGRVGRLTIWALDNTPRLYASGSLYRSSSTSEWTALSDTVEEYRTYVEGLEGPKAVASNPFDMAKVNAKKEKASKDKKEKGKEKRNEEAIEKEREVRKKLEERLPSVIADQEALVTLEAKKIKAAERAQERDARVARQLAKLGNYDPVTTRERRLRTARKVDYTFEGAENELDDEDEYAEAAKPKAKRARGAADSEGEGGYEEEVRSRRGGRRSVSAAPEWRGERRSTRIQLKDSVDEDEDGDEVGEDEGATWARDAPPETRPSSAAPSVAEGTASTSPSLTSSPTEATVPEESDKSLDLAATKLAPIDAEAV